MVTNRMSARMMGVPGGGEGHGRFSPVSGYSSSHRQTGSTWRKNPYGRWSPPGVSHESQYKYASVLAVNVFMERKK
jgi:hypothetical protein